MSGWLSLATERSVVRRACAVAAVVGTVLVAINHGDALLRGDLSVGRLVRIVLTMLVPYRVSTYSSVGALRQRLNQARARPCPSTIAQDTPSEVEG